ncbi:hypothetical protein ACFLUF_00715, partial [Chloroflexota bacterium]
FIEFCEVIFLNIKYINIRRVNKIGYLTILAAVPGFFLSSFIFMLLWHVIASKIGMINIDYPLAMLMTITHWLAVAPLAAAAARRRK